MDVISTVRPENHVLRTRLPVGGRAREKTTTARDGYRETRKPRDLRDPFSVVVDRDATPRARFSPFRKGLSLGRERVSFSLAFALENPAVSSFPLALILAMTVLVSLAPTFDRSFGCSRLDRFEFPSDTSDESAMRLLVTPEPDASLLAEGAEAELPATIRSVSYSVWRVRSGDTLGGILARFGLRNMSTVLSANGISNARRLRVGQTLSIPSMDGVVYVVVRGDSLTRVASRYSVPVNAILDANDLSNSTLVAGQRLFIPGATLSSRELKSAMGELFVYPIKGRLTSRFGYRADPFTGVRTFHTGIDLAAAVGTPVKATLDGRVATTGYSSVYGNYVIITHDSGFQSLYAHLSSIGVSRGQYMAQGAIIGRVGNTGYSTGSHLHLSIYRNGKMIDPFSVLN